MPGSAWALQLGIVPTARALGFFADPFLPFGGGASGGPLAAGAAGREGEDRGVQPGDHVVREQQCPGLLAGEFRGASAQDAAGAADGPFQVRERDFDEPSFLVQDGEPGGGLEARVQERGEQPDVRGFRAAAAGAGQHGEADQPRDGVRQGRDAGVARSLAAARSHAGALSEQDQLRTVFQHVKDPERDAFRGALDAPQQVGAGTGEPDEAIHGE